MNSNKDNTQYPDPLQAGKWFNIGLWAPPSIMLSWGSLISGLVVFWFLQRDDALRSCFRVASWDGLTQPQIVCALVVGCMCLLSWCLVIQCGKRPGHLFPHIWTLILAGLTTTATFMQIHRLSAPDATFLLNDAQLDAFTIAAIAATIALLPRFIRFYPDSEWVARITPVSLVGVLLLFIPIMWVIGGDITAIEKKNSDNELKELEQTGMGLKACDNPRCLNDKLVKADSLLGNQLSCGDQVKLTTARNELRKDYVMAAMKHLSSNVSTLAKSDNIHGDLQRYETLNKHLQELGNQAQLTKTDADVINTAYNKLLESIIGSLYSEDKLIEAPLIAEGLEEGKWKINNSFPEKSVDKIKFYRNIHTLFDKVKNLAADTPLLTLENSPLEAYLDDAENSWNYWTIPYLQDDTEAFPAKKGIDDIGILSFINDLSLSKLDKLFSITMNDFRALKKDHKTANCEESLNPEEGKISIKCRFYEPISKNEITVSLYFSMVYDVSNPNKPTLIVLYFPVEPNDSIDNLMTSLVSIFRGRLTTARANFSNKVPCPNRNNRGSSVKSCISKVELSEDNHQTALKVLINNEK